MTKTEAEGTYNYAFDTGLLLKGDELFLTDELTSPVGRIGRAGDVHAASSYDEFGIELGGQADDDFAFTGYQRDSIIVGDEKW